MPNPLPLRKPKLYSNDAPYVIEFTDVPTNMAYLIRKHPRFATKMDAFRALANYEFEFGAYGNVYHINEGHISVEQIIIDPIEPEKY